MATDAPAPPPSALVDFIAGTAAGVASLLAGHPFDTVKTRLQTQPHSLPPHPFHSSQSQSQSSATYSSIAAPAKRAATAAIGPSTSPLAASTATSSPARSPSSSRNSHHAALITTPPLRRPDGSIPIYRSATHAFRVIIKEEKVLGLYKGVTSPMLGVAIMNASIFGLYGLALRFQQDHGYFSTHEALQSPSDAGGLPVRLADPTLTQIMIAGMVSGLGSSLITAPIELIKIREQMDLSSRFSSTSVPSRTSTYRTLITILRTEGLFRGLFRGWGCTAIRDLGYGPYFWSYELMTCWLASRGPQGSDSFSDGRLRPLGKVELAVSGGIAGVLAWLSTFWADVIKTKIQATTHFDDHRAQSGASTASPTWKRSLFLRTAADTYRNGGARAFFAGVGPTILRALPVNAVMFIVFESVKDALVARGL